MNSKIEAKDLITLGIFTVIYFVIGAALSLLVSIPIMVPFFPAVWALINGTVFILIFCFQNQICSLLNL